MSSFIESKLNRTAKIDLLLINPSIDYEHDRKVLDSLRVENEIVRQRCPHIGIGYLLAVAKEENLRADYIDMVAYEVSVNRLMEYIDRTRPAFIGFTAFTIQIKAAGKIAERIKEKHPDILIGVGGSHATAVPKQTLEEFTSFDAVIMGEGEKTLTEIFRKLDKKPLPAIKGVITRQTTDYSHDRIENLDELPFPAWEHFDLTKYPGADPHNTELELPISTSRGCYGRCVFCVRPFGRRRISRSIDSIIAEIERNIAEFQCQAIYFLDETFVGNLKFSYGLFNEMIKRGLNRKIKWSCETRVDNVSPELFELMKRAGCYYIFFGLESADNEMLKVAGKNFSISQIRKAMSWANEAGIISAGSFILGLPGESEETARKSIELAKELSIYSTTFPIAVPFPGTEIRRMAENNEYGLRILSNDWDDYGKQFPGVMESSSLSIQRLRELQKEAYEFNPKKTLSELEEVTPKNA